MPVIPKSNNEAHLKANMELFDWTLSDEDMNTLTQSKTPAVCGGYNGIDSGDCGYE